ncbi:LOW QUALITY PROTEIN: 10 kDa heat shock protein, mitochondrial-like [Pogonomyrmex barbatus]|uniref:10 kDa heat shock protein, mitochondrial n=1 Tax=Pogonomyrmex barbatus TaxID=144034 RepID=A0A6I9WRV7_9HYME|nr:LOW QUALITY PROTEIN: 10 kDa heat shock protein, mitochondrial-like [Pogonomyrmex barbatus]
MFARARALPRLVACRSGPIRSQFRLHNVHESSNVRSPPVSHFDRFGDCERRSTTMAANAVKRLIPLFDRVLVQRAEAITKTKGGIVLPEKAQAKVLQGTVIATGPGARNDKGEHVPLSIKIGDVVLLPEYGGTKVELEDNKEYHLFRESDILAKVEV